MNSNESDLFLQQLIQQAQRPDFTLNLLPSHQQSSSTSAVQSQIPGIDFSNPETLSMLLNANYFQAMPQMHPENSNDVIPLQTSLLFGEGLNFIPQNVIPSAIPPSPAVAGSLPKNIHITQPIPAISQKPALSTPQIASEMSLHEKLKKKEEHRIIDHSSGIDNSKLPQGLIAVPDLSIQSVDAILDTNAQLISIMREYQNNGWINEPELKLYYLRLQTNLAYLAALNSHISSTSAEPKTVQRSRKKRAESTSAAGENPTEFQFVDGLASSSKPKQSVPAKKEFQFRDDPAVNGTEIPISIPPPTCLLNPTTYDASNYKPVPPFAMPTELSKPVDNLVKSTGIQPGGESVDEEIARKMWDLKVKFRGSVGDEFELVEDDDPWEEPEKSIAQLIDNEDSDDDLEDEDYNDNKSGEDVDEIDDEESDDDGLEDALESALESEL